MVGLRNTLLMPFLKTCSTWPMTMDGTLALLKKYKTSGVTNRLLLLVTNALQKPCQDFNILRAQLKVGMSKFYGKINQLIGFLLLKSKSQISLKLLKPLYNWIMIGNLYLIDGYENSSRNVIEWLVSFMLPYALNIKWNLLSIYLVLWKRTLALMKRM